MKLFQIVLNIAIGIAAGAQPIVGYNYGAKRCDRVRELLGLMLKWTVLVGLVCTLLFEAAPGVFIRMFGSADDPVYFQFAVLCLRIYLALILVTCVQKVCAIFLQSIGRAKAAAPLAILRDVLAILVTAGVMVRVWKELGQSRSDPVQRAISAQSRAIQQIAQAGSCVLIGRSADYVLRNYKDVVRIFIHAPRAYREKKVMEMYGDSPLSGPFGAAFAPVRGPGQ
ncbi:MATE family efflux transporter [Oscillospiraceae bacterium 50-16]